jgi:hypothetical protein
VSLIGELGPGLRRVTVALLALSWLLAGCSTVTAGLALPADHDGPAPVKKTALRSTLLNAREINTVMGASSMKKHDSINELLPDDRSFDRSCLAPWQPIQRSVYADSGWTAVRAQLLSDEDDGHRDHVAIEAVVGFPSRTEAAHFFEAVTPDWTSCGGGQFSTHTGDGDESEWEFSTPEATESTLSVMQPQLHTPGWACQHTLRASNNVVIDVLTCGYDTADDATHVVDEIDAKLPSV